MRVLVWIVCFCGVCVILTDNWEGSGKNSLLKISKTLCISKSRGK